MSYSIYSGLLALKMKSIPGYRLASSFALFPLSDPYLSVICYCLRSISIPTAQSERGEDYWSSGEKWLTV